MTERGNKRKIDEVLKGLQDHTTDNDTGDEIRTLLQLKKGETHQVFDVKPRETLRNTYGEIGDYADNLRIISKEVNRRLENYLHLFVKGVVSENSGKKS